MAIRKIRTFDDEILRKKSKYVENVDNKIREILNDMAETMYNTPNGGGLAACQVGVLKRLVVIDLGEGLIKLVNPEIIKQEGEQIVVEGCLSFPELFDKLSILYSAGSLNREYKNQLYKMINELRYKYSLSSSYSKIIKEKLKNSGDVQISFFD
ncbi:peptide deformylase [Clostridioides difficile]|nr:peptide deformylase [Clostridioides difficile]